MPQIDYSACRKLLEKRFHVMEAAYLGGETLKISRTIAEAYDLLFESATQAYRETLLGCVIARIQDRTIDIRLPYTGLGENAYSGRTVDEKAINPFLMARKIPCSKGPFLSVFRRSVSFISDTRGGLRDKRGYDAFLEIITVLENATRKKALAILDYHLYRFLKLREESHVEIAKLRRISLEQCRTLISRLLEIRSGGRFPLLLIVAAFKAIVEVFELDWEVEYQGINVANGASGAGGDVTLKQGNEIFLSAEVTERPVDRSRVIATFDTKIAPKAIEDYLFFIKNRDGAAAAIAQAKRYFSQGHEVNFLEITDWIVTMLSLLGKKGRRAFMDSIVEFLEEVETPTSLKVAWNDTIISIASAGS